MRTCTHVLVNLTNLQKSRLRDMSRDMSRINTMVTRHVSLNNHHSFFWSFSGSIYVKPLYEWKLTWAWLRHGWWIMIYRWVGCSEGPYMLNIHFPRVGCEMVHPGLQPGVVKCKKRFIVNFLSLPILKYLIIAFLQRLFILMNLLLCGHMFVD